MNKIFSKRIIISLVFLGLLVFVSQAQALDVGLQYGEESGLGTEDFRITVANIIKVSLGLLGVVAVAIILYGGAHYMFGRDDAEKIKKAKKIIISAVIGLVIILTAFSITNYILNQIIDATGKRVATQQGPANGNVNINGSNTNLPPDGQPEEDIGLAPETEEDLIFDFILGHGGEEVNVGEFRVEQTIVDFYQYEAGSSNLSMPEILAANKTISFIYADTLDPNNLKYYLINIHSKKSTTAGNFNGSLTNAKDYFSFTVKDDPTARNYPCDGSVAKNQDAYGDCGDKLLYNNFWAICCTDGEVIYIGDGSEALSFNLNVNRFEPGGGNPEWWFYSPQQVGGILLATEFPATATIDFQPTQPIQ